TAAAVTLSRNLQHPLPPNVVEFLLGLLHPQGGFLPFEGAPMPDLLSTAVTLHALDGLQAPIEKLKEHCLDYVDTLWTAEGGFHGSWEDDELDLEYTYYGLLALGHLAL
ncbi:MAG: prenyltransferase/squalene oxidase repeat-containing protein, partial [Verrucomicrobiota bacterium]